MEAEPPNKESKIYFINVGANTGHQMEARSPVFSNGSFKFVTFPDTSCPHSYPKSVEAYVSDPKKLRTHLDPDLIRRTYGDYCKNRRARALLKAVVGDILLFWGLLWRVADETSSVWKCKDRGWYIIGAIKIHKILKSGEGVEGLTTHEQKRALLNAHMIGNRVDDRELVRVFLGDPRYFGLLSCAVDLEVYHDNGLMRKIVYAANGRPVNWHTSPRWNSVTRSCRAILDMSIPVDRERARLLQSHIAACNPGFKLLDDLKGAETT